MAHYWWSMQTTPIDSNTWTINFWVVLMHRNKRDAINGGKKWGNNNHQIYSLYAKANTQITSRYVAHNRHQILHLFTSIWSFNILQKIYNCLQCALYVSFDGYMCTCALDISLWKYGFHSGAWVCVRRALNVNRNWINLKKRISFSLHTRDALHRRPNQCAWW